MCKIVHSKRLQEQEDWIDEMMVQVSQFFSWCPTWFVSVSTDEELDLSRQPILVLQKAMPAHHTKVLAPEPWAVKLFHERLQGSRVQPGIFGEERLAWDSVAEGIEKSAVWMPPDPPGLSSRFGGAISALECRWPDHQRAGDSVVDPAKGERVAGRPKTTPCPRSTQSLRWSLGRPGVR
eukprot:s3942_g3.t2